MQVSVRKDKRNSLGACLRQRRSPAQAGRAGPRASRRREAAALLRDTHRGHHHPRRSARDRYPADPGGDCVRGTGLEDHQECQGVCLLYSIRSLQPKGEYIITC